MPYFWGKQRLLIGLVLVAVLGAGFLAAEAFAGQVPAGQQQGGGPGRSTTDRTTTGRTTTGRTTTGRTTTTVPTTTSRTTTTAPDRGRGRGGPTTTATTPTTTANPNGVSIVLHNQTWDCEAPVNLTSVTVVMDDQSLGGAAAVKLGPNCSGTIGSINVTTSLGDGIDVVGAAGLHINGGNVTCSNHAPSAHQDGIQAWAGDGVVFTGVTVDCSSANNAGFYVNGIGRYPSPSGILFVSGHIGPTQNSTAFVNNTTGSGVENSVLCRSRYFTYRKRPWAIDSGNSYPSSC